MSAAKNNSHQEQSIGKTVRDFFTSILGGKSTPSPTTKRQRETDQTKRHGNKHRHHHRHRRHGPHEFDREATQGFEYPLNCGTSANAGFWEKAHTLQAEAVVRRPPQVIVRGSNRILADLGGGIDALAPRKKSTNPAIHRGRRHREHHSSDQNKDPVSKPPQSTVRQGKDRVVEKETRNEIKPPPQAAHNPSVGFGSYRRRRHYDPHCPEDVTKIPPVMKLKSKISPKADKKDLIQDIHPALRNRQVTGSQSRSVHRSKCDQKNTLHVEPTRDKASVNLGNELARKKSTTATTTLVESIMSKLSGSAIKESYLQEIPPRQNVLRHQGVQLMHAQRPKGWHHSQEAIIINPEMSDRDSVQTRLSDFMPKPLKLKSTRTAAKSVLDISSYSAPSTPTVKPSPPPKATRLPGVVDDDGNRESELSSSKPPPLKQAIYTSPQFNRSSPISQTRGNAPESHWEDSFLTQASPNEAQFCRICHKPCVQDRRIREVEHILCPTCEARAFIQPYPTIAKMVDSRASRVGSPASFDRPRRTSGPLTPGRMSSRDTPTSPTLHEVDGLLTPPPVPPKNGTQLPRLKDHRGQVMLSTPPSSSGSSYSRFCGAPRVIPPTPPSQSLPMSQIPRPGDNPNFPRGGRVWTLTPPKNNRVQPDDSKDLAPSSKISPSYPPSMAGSYITCTEHDSQILPFILAGDKLAGLGITFGGGDEQEQQQQAAARSPRSPSSPMENRERNFVGRYQNKWGLPYSPSVTTSEDRNEGVNRPNWYYQHYDQLLGDHHHHHNSGDDGGGGGGGGDADRSRKKKN